MTEDGYHDHGTKTRRDGDGDGWAKAHRAHLGTTAYMVDVDEVLVCSGEDRTFVELGLDSFANKDSLVRRVGFLAFVERKVQRPDGMQYSEAMQVAAVLQLCRILSAAQPVPCRFFFCYGGHRPPWVLEELDIDTGERVETREPVRLFQRDDWPAAYERLGLTEDRRALQQWLRVAR